MTTSVTSGQIVPVTSGQFVTGDLVEGGGTIQVFSSGTATSNTLSGTSNGSAAELEVFSGGLASGTIISSGGAEFDFGSFPSPPGTSISSVVLNGGLQLVSSGGVASGATIFTGGQQQVFATGEALNTVVNGGSEFVFSGGTLANTVVSTGFLNAGFVGSSGGHIFSATIKSGGSEFVYSGGIDQNATVSSGGFEILSGGSSFLATIGSGASEQVFSGGYASKETVSGARALLTVHSSGFAGGTIIANGGQQQIFAGGSAGLGTDPPLTVNPTTRPTTVNSGGSEFVFSGGVDSGTVINSGGFEEVGFNASGGGTAIATVVNLGGREDVWLGGVASGASIGDDAVMHVRSGGTVNGVTLLGGTLILDGGALTGTGGPVQPIVFNGPDSQLLMGSAPANVLSGFAPGDWLGLGATPFSAGIAVSFNNTTKVLDVASGGTHFDFNLDPAIDYSADTFFAVPDRLGATYVGVASTSATIPSATTSTGGTVASGTLEVVSGTRVNATVAGGGEGGRRHRKLLDHHR